jgi:hypothetical protein
VSAHTPGPWTAQAWQHVTAHNADGFSVIVADVKYVAGETDANARLIAAAPDLLEALSDLLDYAKHGDRSGKGRSIGDVKRDARAAIARATA